MFRQDPEEGPIALELSSYPELFECQIFFCLYLAPWLCSFVPRLSVFVGGVADSVANSVGGELDVLEGELGNLMASRAHQRLLAGPISATDWNGVDADRRCAHFCAPNSRDVMQSECQTWPHRMNAKHARRSSRFERE